MPAQGDETESIDAVLDSEREALTIRLSGSRFDGGRLPLSALSTLDRMNAMVAAIARDLDVASREDAARASRYSKVELALVGQIGEGSAVLRAVITPLILAASGPSEVSQMALVRALPEAVPAVVQAVHQGVEMPLPVSDKTMKLVAEVGQHLGANEELVIQPADDGSLSSAVDDRAATVTLVSSTQARQAQEVSELRSFFITGTIRQLENHGDEPGKLTLASTSGLYSVPAVDGRLVERAAALLGSDRNVVLAISGQGEFDGKGRLKRLTHLTDMQSIDRHFNPDRRLNELAELATSPVVATRIERARLAIERAVLATGRAPGLFLDEDDQLEARWLVRSNPESPARVVNVSFGKEVEVYVFDRATGEVTFETTFDDEQVLPGDLIAGVIRSTAEVSGV